MNLVVFTSALWEMFRANILQMLVSKLDITIDIASDVSLAAGAKEVLIRLRPQWREVRWKTFTDGITNKLIGGWEEGKKEDMVLVRVYGQGTDMIIDREGEMKNMARMQGIGLGGKLYAAFNNGICYQFLAGEVLSSQHVICIAILDLIRC